MAHDTFTVTGMTCAHCEASVREEVSEVAGVTAVEVSATDGSLTVTGDDLDSAAIIAAVTEAGYSATLAG